MCIWAGAFPADDAHAGERAVRTKRINGQRARIEVGGSVQCVVRVDVALIKHSVDAFLRCMSPLRRASIDSSVHITLVKRNIHSFSRLIKYFFPPIFFDTHSMAKSRRV